MTDFQNDRIGPRWSDPSHANAARIQDYILGGSHWFPADKAAADTILDRMPQARALAQYNRRWTQRAVRFLVEECQIAQILDIGAGILTSDNPTLANVHEVAQAIEPTARVVYVDYDKVAIDYALANLEGNDYATAVHADMRQPDTILNSPITQSMLDFTKPIAMLWASMLHFVDDVDDPFSFFAHYSGQLKPGDYVALSHLTWQYVSGEDLEQASMGLDAYNKHVVENLTIRDIDTIMRFFDGTELVEPGLVPLADWKPDSAESKATSAHEGRTILVGGVGRLV